MTTNTNIEISYITVVPIHPPTTTTSGERTPGDNMPGGSHFDVAIIFHKTRGTT